MSIELYQKRYGKYPILHVSNFIGLALLCCMIWFGFICSEYGIEDVWVICWYLGGIGSSLGGFIYSYHPFTEKFYVKDNVIFHKKGNYEEQIKIHSSAVFVISNATLNFYYYNKYMINVVAEKPEVLLDRLHQNEHHNAMETGRRNPFKRTTPSYDNIMVRGYMKNRWYYCFLYEKNYAEQFFYEQQKPIIIPRSIANKIDLDMEKFNVIIDEKG